MGLAVPLPPPAALEPAPGALDPNTSQCPEFHGVQSVGTAELSCPQGKCAPCAVGWDLQVPAGFWLSKSAPSNFLVK